MYLVLLALVVPMVEELASGLRRASISSYPSLGRTICPPAPSICCYGVLAPQGGGEFVWYENPKMSVEDAGLYHVQVFWKRAAPSGVSAAAIAAVRSMSRQSTARAECAGPAAHVGAPAGDHRGVDAPALGTEAATCGAHAPAAPDQHPSPQQTVFSSEQVERAVDAAMQLLARRIEGTVVGQDGPQAPLPE
jgi:hypothetical protein